MLRPNDKVRPFYARLAAELDAKEAKWKRRTVKNVGVSVRRPLALAALAGVFKDGLLGQAVKCCGSSLAGQKRTN
jgi:hypothetical protein